MGKPSAFSDRWIEAKHLVDEYAPVPEFALWLCRRLSRACTRGRRRPRTHLADEHQTAARYERTDHFMER